MIEWPFLLSPRYNPRHFWDLSFSARQKRIILPKRENIFSKADVTVTRTDHWWENQCSKLRCDHLTRRYLLKSCSTEQGYQQSQEPWKLIEIEPDRYRRYWLFTIYKKSFRKIRREGIWNTNFWVIFSVIHSFIHHSFLFFRKECSKRIFVFHFSKAIFDTSLRLSRPFRSK